LDEKTSYHDWKKSVNHILGHDFWNDFQDVFTKEWPQVNLYESEDIILCLIALPGVKTLDDIHLYIHHTTLLIKGHIHFSFPGYKTVDEELYKGSFDRTIELPFPVQSHPLEATFNRGLMSIKLQRLTQQENSEIMIKDED